jgi:hypothetical protein
MLQCYDQYSTVIVLFQVNKYSLHYVVFHCNCPKRLASNTVEGIINQLVNIFDDIGLGRDWNIVSESGNPASVQSKLFP